MAAILSQPQCVNYIILLHYLLPVCWVCCISHTCQTNVEELKTLRPRQNGRHFADDIFKRIFFNENVWISIKISLKFVPKGPINIIPAMFQIMAWCRPGAKPLSEVMLVSLPMHICVTWPQWVKKMQKKIIFLQNNSTCLELNSLWSIDTIRWHKCYSYGEVMRTCLSVHWQSVR